MFTYAHLSVSCIDFAAQLSIILLHKAAVSYIKCDTVSCIRNVVLFQCLNLQSIKSNQMWL